MTSVMKQLFQLRPKKEEVPIPREESSGVNLSDETPPKKTVRNPRELVKRLGFGLIMLICLYLILMPFLPLIPYYFRELTGQNTYTPIHTTSDGTDTSSEGGEVADEDIPSENTIVVPSVGIDVQIVEGDDDSALDRGAWHRPGTGTPESGGNMVVTGHRFKYLPPSNLTFYHLDKIVVGDYIIVYWKGKRYDYQVDKITTVEPSQVEVEAPTAEPQLTLYTCTPLWTAKYRLVVVALPVANEEEPSAPEDDGDGTVDLEQVDGINGN
jgi:LPXTG-site transpeptidase (sortase) family protein